MTVGFADDPGGVPGAVVVAAGSVDADWALNLLADPSCDATIADHTFGAVAVPLSGADHAATIRALILRYGTSAEGLGHGPSFRLVPSTTTPASTAAPIGVPTEPGGTD